ncbi:replication endonuclease [Litoribrevibacter albus]|nr:replication endonuclease [Litoribrevibacter albus]
MSPLGHNFGTSPSQPFSPVFKAISLTKELGTHECHQFRERIFTKYEYLCSTLAHHYLKKAEQKSVREANLALIDIDKRLSIKDLNLSWDDQQLTLFAHKQSHICCLIDADLNSNREQVYERCKAIANKYQISEPEITTHQTINSCINRMKDKGWWLKKIRNSKVRAIEALARDLALVQKSKTAYCSHYGYELHQQQQRRNREHLENHRAINQFGQQFSLADLFDSSVSNPSIRRAELMTRIKGFEMIAEQYGHASEFITITCPSRMHAISRGKRNPNYDDTTPKQANKYLGHIWSLIRSSLSRQEIQVYGFRVSEPHHDGTPHWHMLLFMKKEHVSKVIKTMRSYSLKTDGNEPGAAKHRFQVIDIDPEKGSATAYVSKYISKNVDGKHIEKDLYDLNAKNSAERIQAWASIWGIRQFQQIGGPSVTVWRELRRLRDEQTGKLEEARLAADAGDWAAYVMTMGGPTLPKKDRPIQPFYEHQDEPVSFDVNTGEIQSLNTSKYGDTPKGLISGLLHKGEKIKTRLFQWTMEKISTKTSAEMRTGLISNYSDPQIFSDKPVFNSGQPLIGKVGAAIGGMRIPAHHLAALPWTRVNNCTPT